MRMGPEPLPVEIRGVRYANALEAAKALGVKRNTIYCALGKGRIDYVGLGKGSNRKRKEERHGPY